MDPKTLRALVVDDEPFARKVLMHQLDRLGLPEVRGCTDAQEALAALDAAADHAAFDLLFCDLIMPGMDGIEFVRHLAQRRFAGRVVLVSAAEDRILRTVERLARAHDLTVLDALHKPVSAAQLRALLARAGAATAAAAASAPGCDADDLRQALAAGELCTVFQPQVELQSLQFVGVEALVRWQHPREGLLPPHRFIGTAEDSGLIDELTRTVLAQATAQLRAWRRAGLDLRLAINVSMRSLDSLRLPDEIAAMVDAAGLPRDRLIVEVTESHAMQDPKTALEIASRLRLKGIGLSIDDFGTGYASLQQLRDLPFDELKIDRGFVHRAGQDPVLHAILRANVELARQLGLRTVAEGVEDDADLECVRGVGCTLAQGYRLARPLPPAEVIPWAIGWAAGRPAGREPTP